MASRFFLIGGPETSAGPTIEGHLTGVKKESFYWRTKTIAHNNAMSVKKFIRSKLRAL